MQRIRPVFLFFSLVLFWSTESIAQFEVFGNASGSCDCYTLTTTSGTFQAGSIWSPEQINLNNPFDFTFTVNLGDQDADGADGMVFVLRPTEGDPGTSGGDLGYGDISNSIGVEIDTWQNFEFDDPAGDHLALNADGTVDHALVSPIEIPNIEDGEDHLFRITWEPDLTLLSVYLDGVFYFDYSDDLIATIFGGNPNVYFGWTAGTGSRTNLQRICAYREIDFFADNEVVCTDEVIAFTNNSSSDLIYNEVEITHWLWSFGDGASSNAQNPTHAYSNPGYYEVELTITDISGCTRSESVIIQVLSLPIEVVVTSPTCNNTSDGTITITPDGGTAPYLYEIRDEDGNLLNPDNANALMDLDAGIYTLYVEDANGCKSRDTVELISPFILFTISDELKCAPYLASFYNPSLVEDGATFLWEFGDGATSTDRFPKHLYTTPGTYDVTLTILTPSGCEMILERTGLVTIYPSPTAGFKIDSYREDLYHADFTFSDESEGAIHTDLFFGDGFHSGESEITHTYLESGTYFPYQIVENEYGCQDTARSQLIVVPVIPILIPNAFTPDGDPYNHVFQPVLYSPDVITIQIFNRWGEQIYKTTAFNAFWDGTYPNGQLVPTGTYPYLVTYMDYQTGIPVEVLGHVTVLR